MCLKIPKILLIFLIINTLLLEPIYPNSLLLNSEYLTLIQQKITSCLIYPGEARAKGWEGISTVRFVVSQDGRIKEIDLAESSGYPLLDAAAILAIKDASPYPFPSNYPEEELEIIIPLAYEQDNLSSSEEQLPLSSTAESNLEASPLASRTINSGELKGLVDLALKNNQPTQVAREEIELAQLKVVEAQRNIFPSLKISGYTTSGDVFKINYEEREAKVEATQPIYYGRKLINSVKQAKTNLEISRKNYDRLQLDVKQKTEVAYYNLIAAKMHLKLKQASSQEAEEMLNKIEELYKSGMVIPVEASSARSWYKQIQLQLDTVKHDISMAELTLQQVLNSKETPRIQTQSLEVNNPNNSIELPTCLDTAFQKRPEIYLSQLMVKFNHYGRKIKQGELNAFTVDLTGSYGSYQGHYKTEPWKDSNNWFAGIKVSKPLGANTLNTSYNKEESQPRFGQTSPTGARTLSGEFLLLDNMKRLAEMKKSDIDMQRSLSDFNETLKTIKFEVQDAFLNYEKAVLEFNTAQAEMEFRQNNKEVAKIRAMTGETTLSTAMEAIFNLTEAQNKYIQALANYHISIANLKKATGYGVKI